MRALSLPTAAAEVNLVQNLVVTAMMVSCCHFEVLVKRLHLKQSEELFAQACNPAQFEVLEEAHDALPMSWDWFEVVRAESTDTVKKELKNFGLEGGSRVGLQAKVGTFEGPTEG